MLRKTHFDNVPIKPQRVYEEMNKAFGRDTCYVTTIGLSQIAGAQFLHVYKPRNWINSGQAGPLGWTLPAALGVRAADPDRKIVALSGDYDFQFMIEELAVGAQFKLPYIHVVVNNSYLGLIRQAQRGFDMDYSVQLSFENINAPETWGLWRRSCRGRRRPRLQGDPRHAPRTNSRAHSRPRASADEGISACLSWSSSFSNASPTSRWAPRSTTSIEFEEILDLPIRRCIHEPGADAARERLRRRHGRPGFRSGLNTVRRTMRGHSIVPKFAANLTMLFNELPFLDRFAAAKAAGFSGVEYLFPYDFEKAVLREQLQQHGLTQVLHNLPAGNWAAGERGIAIFPDRVDEFRDGVLRAIDYAKALDCRQVNCLVGVAPADADVFQLNEVLLKNLRFAADALARERIRLLIEPINTPRYSGLLPEQDRAGGSDHLRCPIR